MKVNIRPGHLVRKLRRDLLSYSPGALVRYAGTLVRVWRVSRGEFYVPQPRREDYRLYGDLQNVCHLARYEWAARVLADFGARSVVDVACGAGYGSYRLAQAIPRVFGVDANPAAIRYASATYSHPNLRFVCSTLADIPSLEGGAFDAVTSFDTIEHLDEDSWVEPLRRCLRPGGLLLLSTPMSPKTSRDPGNPHHKVEYCPEDLMQVLARIGRPVGGADLPRRAFLDEVEARAGRPLFRNVPVVCHRR